MHDIHVVYWPSTRPNMPFQRRGSCIFHWRRWAWLTIWDKVKSHGTVRLMHRKRVTCELHDSYFRSMIIQHAIPRTAEVTYSDDQLWGDTEWAIELLYDSVKTGSQFFLDQTRWCQDMVEKASSQQKDEPPGLWLSSLGEQERHNTDGHKSGGQYIAVLFGLQLPLTHTTLSIKWEVYFSKNCVTRLVFIIIVSLCSASICIWLYNYTHIHAET